MTSPPSFNLEELNILATAVMLSGMAVSIVDVGFISTALEAKALVTEISKASETYPNNSIIQAVFSEQALRNAAREQVFAIEIKREEFNPQTAVDLAIAKINQALEVLDQKVSPKEIQEYKEFIYSCAEQVANAAGSGLLGSENPQVDDKEAAALARLKLVLGL